MTILNPTDFAVTTNGDGRRVVSIVGGGGGSSLSWYNVKNPIYGALGDDSTDDHDAFIAVRDAIWAAGVAAVIYIPPGIYRNSNYIQLQDATHQMPIYVLGDWCVLRSTTDTSFFYRKYDDSGDFSEVTQVVIDGCYFLPTVSGDSTGVHSVDSWGTIVRRCHFKNLKIGFHIQAVDSWNEGWKDEDNIYDNCTTAMDFNNAGGTGSFQSGRAVNLTIRPAVGGKGIRIHDGANMYGSHFQFNIWPGGNNTIGIDIDGNIHSCKFEGIIDNAGAGGSPLFGMRFGTNTTNSDHAQFSIDFAGVTYTGGDSQTAAVENAFGKTWYYDPLPFGKAPIARHVAESNPHPQYILGLGVDNPPVSPNAMDDEFDDTTGMSGTGNGLNARWAWRNQGSATFTFPVVGWGKLTVPTAAGPNFRHIEQSIPASQNFEITAKFNAEGKMANYWRAGLTFTNSGGAVYVLGVVFSGDLYLDYNYYSNATTYGSSLGVGFACGLGPWYLRFKYTLSGTKIDGYFSKDAISWLHFAQFTDGITITKVGMGVDQEGSGEDFSLWCDWFRRTA